jgi:hypothetical protein
MQDGQVAGFYDFTSKNPNPDLRGGHGTRIRVGDIFEIHDMSEFSDSSKTGANGRRGWMELVDAAPTVTAPKPQVIPGQVPGQAPAGAIPVDVLVASGTKAESPVGGAADAPTGNRKVI